MGYTAVTRLADALANVQLLGLDTAPIIYFVEANPTYQSLVNAVFGRLDRQEFAACTSVVTIVEVLAKPRRDNAASLEAVYLDLLLASDDLRTLPVGEDIADLAATLRARYALRTPDALPWAVAWDQGCQAFLTNDARLQRVQELQVWLLDDLELGRRR